MPEGEQDGPLPVQQKLFPDYHIDAFYLSDGDASWNFRTHPVPMLHQLADCPPPPLSIYFSTRDPRGFTQFIMPPSVDDNGRYRYACHDYVQAKQAWEEPFSGVVIPGAYRSVVWMRSPGRQPYEGISVEKLATFGTAGYAFSGTHCDTPGHAGGGGLNYGVVPEDLEQAMRRGIYCIQFDEYLGHMYVSTTRDARLHVLDWSAPPGNKRTDSP